MKNDELIALIARVDERTKSIPEIESHLRQINSTITDTLIKLTKTSEIACNAKDCAENSQGKVNKLTQYFWLLVGLLVGSGILAGGIWGILGAIH